MLDMDHDSECVTPSFTYLFFLLENSSLFDTFEKGFYNLLAKKISAIRWNIHRTFLSTSGTNEIFLC